MIGESSFERATRINLIAKSLVKGLNEKVKAYFVLIEKEFNENDFIFTVANKYSALEVKAIKEGEGTYLTKFGEGWTLFVNHENNKIVSELSFNISHSMTSQEVTDEIKYMIF